MPEIVEITDEDGGRLKEEGNVHFKSGAYKDALKCYNNALLIMPTSDTVTRAALYNNLCAVHLKLSDFEQADVEASRALDLERSNSKALFRRAQARKGLERYADAFKDAKEALHFEPKNKTVVSFLERITQLIQEKQSELNTTSSKSQKMIEFAFDESAEMDKRQSAMSNLLVLARETVGSDALWNAKILEKLLKVIRSSKSPDELILAAQRVMDELAKTEERAFGILALIGQHDCVNMMNNKNDLISSAASVLTQRLFNSIAHMDRRAGKKPNEFVVENDRNRAALAGLIFELKQMLSDPDVLPEPRNNVVDLLIKNLMHMDCGLPRGFSWEFLSNDGLERLLKVACCIPELGFVPVNSDTRNHVAVCLNRLYDDCVFDKYRDIYKAVCEQFISDLKDKGTRESKLALAALVATLMSGAVDVGNALIGVMGLTDMLMEMAASDDALCQSVASEAIVQAASKHDRCKFFVGQGAEVLKKLYKSQDIRIRARALMGLCKCASSGGTDASLQPMAEGSTLKLSEECKRFLLDTKCDPDLRRYAAEGLSYLTLDADIKEWLIEDISLIRSLVDLAREAGAVAVFGVASIFVHLTNMYDKPEPEPELKKLAEFAKHHVPEEHIKDKADYVFKRTQTLVKEGAVSACVALSKTESKSCQELLARSLFAFCKERENRGVVVQEGGAKLLVTLSIHGTEAGIMYGAQALARIAISIDPSIAFPGQRCYEVIKPLINLLHPSFTGLQNYESMLALTNLSSNDNSLRNRMLRDNVLAQIEEYWLMQDHEELRAAAAELQLNIIHSEEAQKEIIDTQNDRLKVWTLYCGEEDERLVSASAGGLALLTQSTKACKRIAKEVVSWLDILKELCMHETLDIQFRGLFILSNMMEADKEIAAKVVSSDVFEILIAITKIDAPDREKQSRMAEDCLKQAEQWELIKPTDREIFERSSRPAKA